MLWSVNSAYTDAITAVFSSTIAGKAWFATAAGVFALIQVVLTRRPVPALIVANFALALVIVVLSGLVTRL